MKSPDAIAKPKAALHDGLPPSSSLFRQQPLHCPAHLQPCGICPDVYKSAFAQFRQPCLLCFNDSLVLQKRYSNLLKLLRGCRWIVSSKAVGSAPEVVRFCCKDHVGP